MLKSPQVLYLDLSYLTHDLLSWLQLPPTSTSLPNLFSIYLATCQITYSHSQSTLNKTRSHTSLRFWVQVLFLQPPSPKPVPGNHHWLLPLPHVSASSPPESPTRLPPSSSLYGHGQEGGFVPLDHCHRPLSELPTLGLPPLQASLQKTARGSLLKSKFD